VKVAREVPASVGQRMLWLMDRELGGAGALNYPVVAAVRGPVDGQRLGCALERLVARHEALRTTFARRGGLLTQLIHEPGAAAVAVRDLSCAADPGAALEAELARETRTRVDPCREPFRFTAWRLGPDRHVVCLNLHHLVTDAWSCGVLLGDLAHALGGGADLPRVGWQYRHYVRWQRSHLAGDGARADREYWAGRLSGLELPELPLRAPGGGAEAGGTARASLAGPAAAGLRALASSRRTTLFTVLLAVYYALLHRLTGRADLAIASLFANRTRPEVLRTVGFFANLVVLRTRVQAAGCFLDLLARTHETVGEARLHQGLPYYLLPQAGQAAGGRRPDQVVFQVLPEIPPPAQAGDLEVEVRLAEVASRFDLELAVLPRPDRLDLLLQWGPGRVEPGWAAGFVAAYASLASRVAEAPALRLG
jgi:hypothetical protein